MKRFLDLPFVQVASDGNIISAWSVAQSGDYATDCATGSSYFTSLAQVIREVKNPLLILFVLTSMIMVGIAGGIEAGFLNAMTASLVL